MATLRSEAVQPDELSQLREQSMVLEQRLSHLVAAFGHGRVGLKKGGVLLSKLDFNWFIQLVCTLIVFWSKVVFLVRFTAVIAFVGKAKLGLVGSKLTPKCNMIHQFI